jgi:hypothetical protein
MHAMFATAASPSSESCLSLPSHAFFLDAIEETYNQGPPLFIFVSKNKIRYLHMWLMSWTVHTMYVCIQCLRQSGGEGNWGRIVKGRVKNILDVKRKGDYTDREINGVTVNVPGRNASCQLVRRRFWRCRTSVARPSRERICL